MKFGKKEKKFHFAYWDEIQKLTIKSNSNIKDFYPYNEKTFDFHGFDRQKTAAVVENLIFELKNSKIRCINLISGIGFGHLYEQILDNLQSYEGQFKLDLHNPGLIRICKN